MNVEPSILEPYYRAGVLGLRALEARTGRRRSFGSEADARWRAFKGAVDAAGRLDLLLRAAAKSSPAAFAPRVIVPLEGIAEDEPFGPEWPGCPRLLEAKLVKEAADPLPQDRLELPAFLCACAQPWGLTPQFLAPAEFEGIGPATRLVAAGAGAVVSLAAHFSGRADLDLPQQVLFVADSPAERQLVGLAVAVLGSASPVQLLAPEEAVSAAVRAAFPAVAKVLVSRDASDSLRSAAEAIARTLAR